MVDKHKVDVIVLNKIQFKVKTIERNKHAYFTVINAAKKKITLMHLTHSYKVLEAKIDRIIRGN